MLPNENILTKLSIFMYYSQYLISSIKKAALFITEKNFSHTGAFSPFQGVVAESEGAAGPPCNARAAEQAGGRDLGHAAAQTEEEGAAWGHALRGFLLSPRSSRSSRSLSSPSLHSSHSLPPQPPPHRCCRSNSRSGTAQAALCSTSRSAGRPLLRFPPPSPSRPERSQADTREGPPRAVSTPGLPAQKKRRSGGPRQ